MHTAAVWGGQEDGANCLDGELTRVQNPLRDCMKKTAVSSTISVENSGVLQTSISTCTHLGTYAISMSGQLFGVRNGTGKTVIGNPVTWPAVQHAYVTDATGPSCALDNSGFMYHVKLPSHELAVPRM